VDVEGSGRWNELEIRIDIHTLPCVKQVASGNLQSAAQCSDDPDGGHEGGGTETQGGGLYAYI